MERTIETHGVADRGEGGIFLSVNHTVVESHVGGDASLHCWVARQSDFGTVRSTRVEALLSCVQTLQLSIKLLSMKDCSV